MKPFTDTLREIRSGLALDELTVSLQQLVLAVRSTGKKGTLTLKIEVGSYERIDAALVIKDTITLALPKIESGGTLMFDTPEGNLSRRNPRQDDLPGISLAPKANTEAA